MCRSMTDEVMSVLARRSGKPPSALTLVIPKPLEPFLEGGVVAKPPLRRQKYCRLWRKRHGKLFQVVVTRFHCPAPDQPDANPILR